MNLAYDLMIQTFEGATKMRYGHPGFDWTCKRRDKIDNKARCLTYRQGRIPSWMFPIRFNNIADWFVLSAWDNRNSLTPLHIWAFHRDDIIRGDPFWMRICMHMSNSEEGLKEFKEYEITNRLEKLKEFINNNNSIKEE